MLNFTFDKRINMDQATNSILMIRPINFGYNEETAGDNHYQNKDSIIKLETFFLCFLSSIESKHIMT